MTKLEEKIQSFRQSVGGVYIKPDPQRLVQYRENLNNSTRGLDYLNIQRGLNRETIDNFKLGYDIEKDAIVIPVFKRNELINLRYRFIDPEKKPKYSQEKGCEVWIYNEEGISKAQTKGGVLITEGEFDCMSAWQAGFKNVISPASGKDSYGVWIELLDSIPKVYIAYDNDKAGKSASLNLAERVGTDKSFEVVYPDGIKDANEYFKTGDAEGFRELVRKARPFYKYKFAGVADVIESLRYTKQELLKLNCVPFVEFEEDWLVILSGVSNIGKCHGKGTKILMYDGSVKNVEDVLVGDYLMGPDSKPKEVLSLARGREQMYRIWERGEYYDVNESHILSLQNRKQDKKTKENKTVQIEKTVKDYLGLSKGTQNSYRGWKIGVEFEEDWVNIDPYFLGLWLGDGTSSKPQFTSEDDEIIKYINEYSKSIGLDVTEREQENNNSITLDIVNKTRKPDSNDFLNFLRDYNLLNNKHIPKNFLINSEEKRLQLLAGLIDTDGHLAKTNRGETYEITQKNTRLANDIVFLARSLGYRATIKKTIKSIKSIGFTGEYNRINIVGDLSRIPVKIKYKKSNFIPKKQWLTSKLCIEDIGVGDYYGFTLSGDGLYLLGSFTVTHNTSFGMNIANECIEKGLPTLIMPFERGIKTVGKRFLQVRYNKHSSEFEGLNDTQWDEIIKDSIDLPLYFSMPSREEIKEIIAKSKRLFGIKMVVVDHLDYLVRKSGENHNIETSNTLQEFKLLAQEHNIVFVIIHHIKKQEGVGSTPKKPKMEDLKGSSSVYQDPEAVIMLSSPDTNKIEVDIVKNKGEMGSKVYAFNLATGRVGAEVEYTTKKDDKFNLDEF